MKFLKVHPSGSVLKMSTFAPWKSHLFDLEKEMNLTNDEIKYVLFEDSSSAWRIQCVPINPNSFINRQSLPEEWWGVRDEELSEKSSIDGCIFVHANGIYN
jgi:uncharacterized UPF0160 family protein